MLPQAFSYFLFCVHIFRMTPHFDMDLCWHRPGFDICCDAAVTSLDADVHRYWRVCRHLGSSWCKHRGGRFCVWRCAPGTWAPNAAGGWRQVTQHGSPTAVDRLCQAAVALGVAAGRGGSAAGRPHLRVHGRLERGPGTTRADLAAGFARGKLTGLCRGWQGSRPCLWHLHPFRLAVPDRRLTGAQALRRCRPSGAGSERIQQTDTANGATVSM